MHLMLLTAHIPTCLSAYKYRTGWEQDRTDTHYISHIPCLNEFSGRDLNSKKQAIAGEAVLAASVVVDFASAVATRRNLCPALAWWWFKSPADPPTHDMPTY